MADALAASLLQLLPGLALGASGPDANNRFSLEGLTVRTGADGATEIGIARLDAAALRLALGPLVVEVARLALLQVVVRLRMEGQRPRLAGLQAGSAELFGVKVQGPLAVANPPKGGVHAADWCLGPLAAAQGSVRARIVDAHLVFDADVTVPIRQGRVNFNEATVEHVGPDSRMGVSRMGLYVDAPNGRSYLYQFSSSPVAGVEFERRGALLGAWVTDRGKLQLQPFAECVLRHETGARAGAFTEQARMLLGRTSLAGELQLGDGRFAAPGVAAEFAGQAQGRNALRLHSEAVGRGIGAEIASLLLRDAVLAAGAWQLACKELTGALALRLFVEGSQLHFALELANTKLSALEVRAGAAR